MIRAAETSEYNKIIDFYYRLIDDMQERKYHPKWSKGIYPDPDDIKEALELYEIFVYEESNTILSAMRINHTATDGYEKASWAVSADDDEVTVIHILGVAVPYQRKGIARKMVRFVIDKAKAEMQKAVRLDVMTGNIPANKLYESMGFEYRDKVALYYEDTGTMNFELYELVL